MPVGPRKRRPEERGRSTNDKQLLFRQRHRGHLRFRGTRLGASGDVSLPLITLSRSNCVNPSSVDGCHKKCFCWVYIFDAEAFTHWVLPHQQAGPRQQSHRNGNYLRGMHGNAALHGNQLSQRQPLLPPGAQKK